MCCYCRCVTSTVTTSIVPAGTATYAATAASEANSQVTSTATTSIVTAGTTTYAAIAAAEANSQVTSTATTSFVTAGTTSVTQQSASSQVMQGSLTFQLDDATSVQVKTAVSAALMQVLGVSASPLTVTARQLESRRLLEARRLAARWTVTFPAKVSQEQLPAVVSAAALVQTNITVFRSFLETELIAAGVDSKDISASLVVSESGFTTSVVSTAETTNGKTKGPEVSAAQRLASQAVMMFVAATLVLQGTSDQA
ncbi:unnamed protein product [Polarella glacialis]|uniref:Uncharacterized protein n=1 Tax=Polarella glacialis TaxID=89957 RepID=A0A813HFC6_POLGL|nr:unnamed protein product [Polarella glacialis]CAE8695821.1 unnamed protein product [Polarella glacialis]